jgi:hypothetical protein
LRDPDHLNRTIRRLHRALTLREMSRERWMALLFALGSTCFLIGPFPGYIDLVGPGADAVTFFAGSILFTAGERCRCGCRWAGGGWGSGSPARSPRLRRLEQALRHDVERLTRAGGA